MNNLIFLILFFLTLKVNALFEPLPSFDDPTSVHGSFSKTGISGGFETPITKSTAKSLFGDFAGGDFMAIKPDLSVGFQIHENRDWDAYLAFNIKSYIKSEGGTALKIFLLYGGKQITKNLSIIPVAYVFFKVPYSFFGDDMLIVFGGFKGERTEFEKLDQVSNLENAFSLFDSKDKAFGGFTYHPDIVNSSWSWTLTANLKSVSLAVNRGF